ncbi:unnamed protein product [Fraxinus pennsylvanica]|uniref:Pectin acetylesterase n=1 Tax=Fraxinus pennsylvanica TaxID=56036 RepID=A0AAD2ECW4_9LAMI|nr:unnamed protein product [Fraxinus pennsylvanica]
MTLYPTDELHSVCLDGTPPVYHLDRGSEAGINSWLVHIEGGGWSNNITTCLAQKNLKQGSSKDMAKQLAFSGILSNEPKFNPDFYNWNGIKVSYCDGASFTVDVEEVDPAILSGSSAGGLTSIFRSLVPKGAKVKCISDAGYFINVKDISGALYIEDYYNNVVMTHGAATNLPSLCTSKGKPGLVRGIFLTRLNGFAP